MTATPSAPGARVAPAAVRRVRRKLLVPRERLQATRGARRVRHRAGPEARRVVAVPLQRAAERPTKSLLKVLLPVNPATTRESSCAQARPVTPFWCVPAANCCRRPLVSAAACAIRLIQGAPRSLLAASACPLAVRSVTATLASFADQTSSPSRTRSARGVAGVAPAWMQRAVTESCKAAKGATMAMTSIPMTAPQPALRRPAVTGSSTRAQRNATTEMTSIPMTAPQPARLRSAAMDSPSKAARSAMTGT